MRITAIQNRLSLKVGENDAVENDTDITIAQRGLMTKERKVSEEEKQFEILAIDPGNTQSAAVLYNTKTWAVIQHMLIPNAEMLEYVQCESYDHLALEMIACYGMAVGKTVFETVYWIGRFSQMAGGEERGKVTRVYRKDVKMYLCNSMRAKDGNIRQALIDRYEPTGGGKIPQIGTKAKPGPLYGMAKDRWAALGVAVTFAETLQS